MACSPRTIEVEQFQAPFTNDPLQLMKQLTSFWKESWKEALVHYGPLACTPLFWWLPVPSYRK